MEHLRERAGKRRLLIVDIDRECPALDTPWTKCEQTEGARQVLSFDPSRISTAELIAYVTALHSLLDL